MDIQRGLTRVYLLLVIINIARVVCTLRIKRLIIISYSHFCACDMSTGGLIILVIIGMNTLQNIQVDR